MKPFAIWLAVVAVAFGAFAAVTTLTRETRQVFVFVDSSQPMLEVWNDVAGELDRIDDESHAEFALATGQSRGATLVHTWRPTLDLGGVTAFAPCSFEDIDGFDEAVEADQRILVTRLGSCDTDELVDWDVVLLTP